jgi:formylglycine-generating enzyme required for sulfatase activity
MPSSSGEGASVSSGGLDADRRRTPHPHRVWLRRTVLVAAVAGLSGLAACTEADRCIVDDTAMALVPAGEFAMGSRPTDDVYPLERDKEQPRHVVWVDAFLIDVHEVTNAAFERFERAHVRSPLYADCDRCPVTDVGWRQAAAYCAALAPAKRLPTEAEWEKAARAGTDGDPPELARVAWYSGNAADGPRPVALLEANALGLWDMLGNVREWTADWYEPRYYRRSARANPRGPDRGERKVERGGAYFRPARGVTSAIRYHQAPDRGTAYLGFRCARDPDPAPSPGR